MWRHFFNVTVMDSNRLAKIPTPHFIVFYNGGQAAPEESVLKLSSAFEKQDASPDLELQVTVLNINRGFNQNLLEQCQLLKEYVLYVDKVRSHAKDMNIEDAVELAVKESLEEGILVDFLTRCRREAIQMSIFEYNEEEELALLRKDEREEGIEAGIEIGVEIGKISMIRTFVQQDWDMEKIADALKVDIDWIRQVKHLLTSEPILSDRQIAERLADEKKNADMQR